MFYKRLVFVLIALNTLSCNTDKKNNSSINGVWQSIGSGWILHIQDSARYSFHDITRISCLPARQANLDELKTSLALSNDTLFYNKGVMTYKFIRSSILPELCTEALTEEKARDVLFNFEVFAETVREHYAFMELNDIRWPDLYEEQKKKLIENPTETGLYSILEETLEILNDNHAFLEATDEFYEVLEHLENEDVDIAPDEDLKEYGDFVIADMVVGHHLKEDLTKDSWLIKWGRMENNIGYIQVKAMWLYADLEIPQTLIDEKGYVDAFVETFHEMHEGEYINREVEGVRKIMNNVMTDLNDTDSIVIDVRFNGGGQDAVTYEILRHFNAEKSHVAKTKLVHEDSFSPILTLSLEASSDSYLNPVFILTSPQSGSAAESFAMVTMSLSHVKRIGSHTQGALSTALEKTLPNGWVFSISNEVSMDNDGNSYENVGIPVDYELHYPEDRQTFFRSVANDLEMDKQNILKAMKALDR